MEENAQRSTLNSQRPSQMGETLPALLREAFANRKVVYQEEEDLQILLAEILGELGVVSVREFEFSKQDRIDFFIFADGIGIEVKIHGGINSILRQMHRYAQNPAVRELILVCPRPWTVPKTLFGKPLCCVSIFGSLL